MRRFIGFSVALAGASVGAFLLGRGAGHAGSPPAVPSSADVSALQAQVTQLQASVASLAVDRRAPPPAAPSIQAAPERPLASASPREARPTPPTREEIAAHEARAERQLEDLAQNEPRERSWAPAFERQLRDAVEAVGDAGAGSSIDSVSCHTTMCRLEMSHATVAAQQEFLSEFNMHLPPMAGAHVHVTDGKDGPPRSTVDIIREGSPIPGSDAP
jgi:hypothetical protein